MAPILQQTAPAPGSLAVLGSTGSIGRQTLDIVRRNPERLSVLTLSANGNVELAVEQAREFRPRLLAMTDKKAAREAERLLGPGFEVIGGEESASVAASLAGVHTVVAGISGFACLQPVLAALEQGKHIALANKECLVAGGPLVQKALRMGTSCIVPVDSEHSSVFQCLLGRGSCGALRRITLTASGGPFFRLSKEELADMPPERAVQHPRWQMGAKISVDSATLMNKGLEVIEASVLFNLPADKIDVLIHPQSFVHGFAEYEDGALFALLFEPDMRLPIAFALSYLHAEDPKTSPNKEILRSGVPFLDLAAKEPLEFYRPDFEKFPALALCYESLKEGGTTTTVLNAANEEAVKLYLNKAIRFKEIYQLVREVLDGHKPGPLASIEDIVVADAWAREQASKMWHKFNGTKQPG